MQRGLSLAAPLLEARSLYSILVSNFASVSNYLSERSLKFRIVLVLLVRFLSSYFGHLQSFKVFRVTPEHKMWLRNLRFCYKKLVSKLQIKCRIGRNFLTLNIIFHHLIWFYLPLPIVALNLGFVLRVRETYSSNLFDARFFKCKYLFCLKALS